MGKYEPPPIAGAFREEDDGRLSVSSGIAALADWCAGRSWWIRLPLLVYLTYALVRHLKDPFYGSLLFSGITLGIHELGHVLLGFAPQFVSIAGGTLAQLAAPLACAFIFLRQADYFGISVAGCWLSFSLFNVATYMADARARELPLVSLGSGEPIHDWHYMLTTMGLIEHDQGLSALARTAAFCIGLLSIAGGAWMCWIMYRTRGQRVRHLWN